MKKIKRKREEYERNNCNVFYNSTNDFVIFDNTFIMCDRKYFKTNLQHP